MDLNNVIFSGGLSLGIIGWIGYQLKDIPYMIWALIRQRVTCTIETNEDKNDAYKGSLLWIQNKFPAIKEHVSHDPLFRFGRSLINDTIEITNGLYYFMFDAFTFCTISSYMEKAEYNNKRWIRITIYGLNRLKILKDYEDYIHAYLRRRIANTIPITLKVGSRDSTLLSPKRPFSTVFYKRMDEIKSLIDSFLQNQELFSSHGLIYKVGFILYGPPGSGKSSIIRAIASYVDWPVIYINQNIEGVSIHSRSIVVIEDIDTIYSSREGENNKETERLQYVLNLIDGIISPNEIIFIATTNYLDRVDPALKRQGRFDHAFEIGYFDKDDAVAMCKSFDYDISNLDDIKFPISGAILQNKIIYEKMEENKK